MSPNNRIQNFYINKPTMYSPDKIDDLGKPRISKEDREAIKRNIERGIIANRLRTQKHISRKEALERIVSRAKTTVSREILTIRHHRQVVYRDFRGRWARKPE